MILNLKHNPPPPYVVVDRGTKWGNPFAIGDTYGSRKEVIAKYERYLVGQQSLMSDIHTLRGCNLACWCSPAQCHAEVIARYAAFAGKTQCHQSIVALGVMPHDLAVARVIWPTRRSVVCAACLYKDAHTATEFNVWNELKIEPLTEADVTVV